MAVDYDAGTSGAIAAQYADLRSAIASKGEAENTAKEKAFIRSRVVTKERDAEKDKIINLNTHLSDE